MLFYVILTAFAQLVGASEGMLHVARTRVFDSKAAAQEYFGASFAQVCNSGCQISGLHTLGAYRPNGDPLYVCAQWKATSRSTKQTVTCGYDGSWARDTYPSDCELKNEYQCRLASNNCWFQFQGADCGNWCTCWNHNGSGGGGVSQRLGDGLLGASSQKVQVQDVKLGKKSEVGVSYAFKKNDGAGSSQCPWWLPHAYNQLTDGYQVSCDHKGLFCRYPSDGMNFVCSGYNGVWKLQGPAPTPEPTAAPVDQQCPSAWWIWNGKGCNSEGRFCRYPEYQSNYVCSHGKWKQLRPPAPTPTPPPTLPPNPASCPKEEHYLERGNYCSSPKQRCHYANGITWICNHNGVWMDTRVASHERRYEGTGSPKLGMCAFPYGCGRRLE